MASKQDGATETGAKKGELVYRQTIATRLTHWVWALCLFFLLASGLQIFNAHPELYIGSESGFDYDSTVLSIRAERDENGKPAGITRILGQPFDTTGVFGLQGGNSFTRTARAFPTWLTVPSYQDLATGRVVHFFFGWLFAAVFAVWLAASLISGHLRRDIVPRVNDVKQAPRSFADHARFRFSHGKSYNPLQKLSYVAVLLVAFPLMILTGLTMSPGMNAAWPWLLDLFGGRQTARTIHFTVMVLLVLFFVIHIAMVLLAGPLNEMRSMITGWYRTSRDTEEA